MIMEILSLQILIYNISGFVVEFRFLPHEKAAVLSVLPSKNNEDLVLYILKENKHITIAKLVEQTKLSARTVERIIQNLRVNKKLERIGSRKNGEWKVTE